MGFANFDSFLNNFNNTNSSNLGNTSERGATNLLPITTRLQLSPSGALRDAIIPANTFAAHRTCVT